MFKIKSLIVQTLLVCGPALTYASTEQSIDMNRLSDTQVTMADVSKPGSPGKSFVAATIINAPMASLCAILQDYASYPGFMPNTEKVKVTRGADQTSLVDMTLKLP